MSELTNTLSRYPIEQLHLMHVYCLEFRDRAATKAAAEEWAKRDDIILDAIHLKLIKEVSV